MPLGALVLTWLVIAACVGHPDAVRLLAAIVFVRAARALTATGTMALLRKRASCSQHRREPARRVAILVEAVALAASAAALLSIVALLSWAGQSKMAWLCMLYAPVLPVRIAMASAGGGASQRVHRPTVGLLGLALVAAGWFLGADVHEFAMLFVAREWLAVGAAYILPPRVDPTAEPQEPLAWRHIADYSYARGRKQAAYRFTKMFMHALLGPFGSVAARTGRGLRLDRKLQRFVPQQEGILAGISVTCTVAAITVVLWLPEPALLVVAASLLRSAAIAVNILVWGLLSRGAVNVETVHVEEEQD